MCLAICSDNEDLDICPLCFRPSVHQALPHCFLTARLLTLLLSQAS